MSIRTFISALLLASLPLPSLADVPVGDFFKDPEFTDVRLSPTGEYVTVSVPQGDRTVLAAFRVADMQLVGKWDYGEKRHIESVRWVNDERFFMYVSVKLGRFDARQGSIDVYASNIDGSKRADIPNGGTYELVDLLENDPKHILVQRSVDSAFLSKLNVYTGRVRTVASAPLRVGDFVVDNEGEARYVVGETEELDQVTLRRDGDSWVTVHRDAKGGSVRSPFGFDADNEHVFFSVSDKGEPPRIVRAKPEGGDEVVISHNGKVEATSALRSADGREILAFRYHEGMPSYHFVKPDHPESKLYAGLINAFPKHVVSFQGISRNGRYTLFRTFSDMDPGAYYLFDRDSGRAKFLLAASDWIKPEQMSNTRPIAFTSRDGHTVHGYLTVPANSDGQNEPMIVMLHGGPHEVRDFWGYNPEVQFFASRGYAVLQVNFRGSGGYGNAFERLGYRNWGTKMIDDITDAVEYAIDLGVADRNRICTYGASYGGYAALQAVVREPDLYGCTIGYVGVYSLPMMFRKGDIPDTRYGRNFQEQILPETAAELEAQSPAYNVDRIKIPVMLVHGAKDERVPLAQYKLLKDRLEEAGRPPAMTIVEEKEGHGFFDFQNNVELYTAIEKFLDSTIGREGEVTVGDPTTDKSESGND